MEKSQELRIEIWGRPMMMGTGGDSVEKIEKEHLKRWMT